MSSILRRNLPFGSAVRLPRGRNRLIDVAVTKAGRMAIKEMATLTGNSLIAYGSYRVSNPEIYKTQTLQAKYEPRPKGMTSAEVFLSEQAYERFSRDLPRHMQRTGDKGRPTKNQRFSYVTQYERGYVKPKWTMTGGKIVPHKDGADFLHTIEDFETREKRWQREMTKGRTIIGAGALLKWGVPVLMYGWIAHDVVSGNYHYEGGLLDSNRLHDAIGPMALPVTIAADVYFLGGAVTGARATAIARDPMSGIWL